MIPTLSNALRRFRVRTACALLTGTLPLLATPIYLAVQLPALDATPTYGWAINSSGDITGSSGQQAFIYRNGVTTGLGSLGLGASSVGHGINDAGQITGVSAQEFGGTIVGSFVITGGVVAWIPPPPPSDAYFSGATFGPVAAWAINNAGTVTGSTALHENRSPPSITAEHPFTYRNGVSTDANLGIPAPSAGYAINSAGQIAGYFEYGFHQLHPAVFDNGTTDLIEPGQFFSRGEARGINDRGQVAGTIGSTAFLYSAGRLATLGAPVGRSSAGLGLNNLGQVVGSVDSFGTVSYAFLYWNETMLDLNSLLAGDIGTVLTDARGINDRGQIVANGANGQAYLLTPVQGVPEPATWWTGGMAGVVLAVSRRRR